MPTDTALMTTDDLLAMPDDGIERWLVDGELRERHPDVKGERPMTIRNRHHSRTTMLVGHVLLEWVERQSEPRGQVVGGEAGVRLVQDPDTTVGVDVAYITAEVAARQTEEVTIIDGVPTLVAEILSPNDTQEDIHEKIDKYLQAGVALVWILDPADHTVRVYRPDARPQLFNDEQELAAEPHLAGFRVPVARLFG
ncbi:MAG: Uma2 family endonuclease [Gemmataceae bacterium]